MLINEVLSQAWDSHDLLKYGLSVRKLISDMDRDISTGIAVVIVADGYMALSGHLAIFNTTDDTDLQNRLSELRTKIIDAGGSSYLSEST